MFSALYFKSYTGLNKVQRIEWSNRSVLTKPFAFLKFVFAAFLIFYLMFGSGISTVHALFIAAMSLYFVFWSDLYADFQTNGFVTFRSSTLSTFTLGVSVCFLFMIPSFHSFLFRTSQTSIVSCPKCSLLLRFVLEEFLLVFRIYSCYHLLCIIFCCNLECYF